MAKAAVLEEDVTTELSAKQIINAGIARVVEETGIDVQKSRYKAMRAIAFQAFVEAIDAEDFDGLVDRALANADDLPPGWELERAEAAEKPAPKAKAKAAPAKRPAAKKTAAKAPAKAAGRRRPTRKSAE